MKLPCFDKQRKIVSTAIFFYIYVIWEKIILHFLSISFILKPFEPFTIDVIKY